MHASIFPDYHLVHEEEILRPHPIHSAPTLHLLPFLTICFLAELTHGRYYKSFNSIIKLMSAMGFSTIRLDECLFDCCIRIPLIDPLITIFVLLSFTWSNQEMIMAKINCTNFFCFLLLSMTYSSSFFSHLL